MGQFRRITILCVASAALLATLGAAQPGRAESARLRAVNGRLLDGEGRDVILRGIAVIKKESPYLPAVGPDDFARIRSWGMNSIRLGTSWAAIEPQRDVINTAYLDSFATLAREATSAGLYVVVDMHQDLWGPPVGNGAPAWTLQTPCPHVDFASMAGAWAANYFSPAVMCAFTNFWTSEDLQSHYARAWSEVASRLAGDPRVAGYDLMNEPYQGFIPPGAFENGFLYPSQARWIDEIRTVDPDAVGFIEPPNYKNVHLLTAPALLPPANVIYAPHLYGFWDEFPGTAATAREPLAGQNFAHSLREAQAMNVPMWLGEFGMVYDAPGAAGFLRYVYDLADSARAGAALWAYDPGGGYSPVARDGTPREILREVARAYPAAVPGLQSFTFDAVTSELNATWSGDGDAVFAVPSPRFPGAPDVDTDGLSHWDESTAQLQITGGSRVMFRPHP